MFGQIKNIIDRIDLSQALAKSVAVLLSYQLGSWLTFHLHEHSAYIGAMLACTSCIVVIQKGSLEDSEKLAWLRIVGTFLGAVMAFIYLLLFPFSVVGMIVAIFLLDLVCMMLRVPDNGKIASITLVTILIVSEYSSDLSPAMNGLLRFLEAAIGTSIGILAVWVLLFIGRKKELRQRDAAAPPEKPTEPDKIK